MGMGIGINAAAAITVPLLDSQYRVLLYPLLADVSKPPKLLYSRRTIAITLWRYTNRSGITKNHILSQIAYISLILH